MWRQKSLWLRACPKAKSQRDATVRNRRQAESHEADFIHSLEETQLLETDAKLRAMSLLNGRGAKEEDEVNPT